MKNHDKVGFKIQKNRLLWWLIILLTILLVVAIGMFVFLSLNAKYHFACVLGCEPEAIAARAQTSATVSTSVVTTAVGTQSSLRPSHLEAEISEKPTQNQVSSTVNTTTVIKIDRDMIIHSRRPIIHSNTPPTSASTNSMFRDINTEGAKSRSHTKSTTAHRVTSPVSKVNLHTTYKPLDLGQYVNITGKVSFQGKPPKRLPRNSRLIVEFTDSSLADAPSVVLAKTIVDLLKYRRRKPLFYTIIFKRPQFIRSLYSVSAVLNVGWKQTGKKNWIRKGDFFTNTFFRVNIKGGKTLYERNIQLVKYK